MKKESVKDSFSFIIMLGDDMNIKKYIEELKPYIGVELDMIYDNNISFPYIKKPKIVSDLIEEAYKDLEFDTNYEENIKNINNPFDLNVVLSHNQALTVITYCIRKNRFIEGFLMEQVSKGLISKVLLEIKK